MSSRWSRACAAGSAPTDRDVAGEPRADRGRDGGTGGSSGASGAAATALVITALVITAHEIQERTPTMALGQRARRRGSRERASYALSFGAGSASSAGSSSGGITILSALRSPITR
jgi:hypothetical protein